MAQQTFEDISMAKDLERVGALVQGFYKYRDHIGKLLPVVAGSRQCVGVSPEVMAAAWVGFSMARIWPETPRVSESDMPLPLADDLEDLDLEQQQFVAFSYGVLGGISESRPVTAGPLCGIAELAVALAPLVVIPAEAINQDGLVDNGYLLAVAKSLDLSLSEVHKLLLKLGMSQN